MLSSPTDNTSIIITTTISETTLTRSSIFNSFVLYSPQKKKITGMQDDLISYSNAPSSQTQDCVVDCLAFLLFSRFSLAPEVYMVRVVRLVMSGGHNSGGGCGGSGGGGSGCTLVMVVSCSIPFFRTKGTRLHDFFSWDFHYSILLKL